MTPKERKEQKDFDQWMKWRDDGRREAYREILRWMLLKKD